MKKERLDAMEGVKVLTYNVCFGCMLGSEEDKSALPLAMRCAKSAGDSSSNGCLLQVARNIDKAGSICGGLDLIGLQEASAWKALQAKSRELWQKTPVAVRVGKDELVLFVGDRYLIQWAGDGEVSGRPLQVVLLRDVRGGGYTVVVHFHNNHEEKGTSEILQQSIANVKDIGWALDVARDCTVICMGDWNDSLKARRGFKPFFKCACSPETAIIGVSAASTLPRTCCSTDSYDKNMKFTSDYVLSNRWCKNEVPTSLLVDMMLHDASDHYAILATIGRKDVSHPLFHLLCDV
jgi:endonuclease/exonuclease/phosphatase family metal-dependent hydrolase